MSPLCLIPLALDKYEVCCVPTEKSHHACWRDAKAEVVAELTDGSAYFMPVCDNPEHRRMAEEAKDELLKGTNVFEIRNLVMTEQMFLKPAEIPDKKCKVIQWDTYRKMKQLPTSEIPKTPNSSKSPLPAIEEIPKQKVYKVSSKWEWVDDINMWCNIKGEVVSLSKLENFELKITLNAICNANFKKIPAELKWIKEIIVPTSEVIMFGENALVVKARRAKEKLDDFRLEAVRRGIL